MPLPEAPFRPRWQRGLWLVAGASSLLLGAAGIVLPLLPTVPFMLLAAFCFSRGCESCERWLLEHPRLGPPIRQWREHRAVPLRAKQAATVMLIGSTALSWWLLPAPWRWLPGACCLAVAAWLWWLPTLPATPRSQ